jgi:hypothetical protein
MTQEAVKALTKQEMKMLEKVFAAEISGSLLQTKSTIAKSLADREYIIMEEKILGKDRFGLIKVSGYRTTILGNATYCMSDL